MADNRLLLIPAKTDFLLANLLFKVVEDGRVGYTLELWLTE